MDGKFHEAKMGLVLPDAEFGSYWLSSRF